MTSTGFVSRMRQAVSTFRQRRHLARRFGPVKRVAIETHGEGYGSWSMLRASLARDAVVYSFGIGEDIAFERSVIGAYGVTVHAFDPTPRSCAYVEAARCEGLVFTPVGLSDADGEGTFFLPTLEEHVSGTTFKAEHTAQEIRVQLRRLRTIMDGLGHERIDLLKMDIEGSEYRALDDLLAAGIRPLQLLVEFHHRFPEIGLDRTLAAIAAVRGAGYDLVSIADSGEEFAFARLGKN